MSTTATSLAVDLDGVLFPTPVLAASGCFGSGANGRITGFYTAASRERPVPRRAGAGQPVSDVS